MDIGNAYGLIKVWDEDVWKTAICIYYSLFESLVMFFWLTNAPATLQQYVSKPLCPYLDVFCTEYLDDVLINSQTLEEHIQHFYQILGLLQQAGLQVKLQKYKFPQITMEYLGILATPVGLRMDLGKVRAIEQWPVPQWLRDVWAFIRFSNFYRRFIEGFSQIIHPLMALTIRIPPMFGQPLARDLSSDWRSPVFQYQFFITSTQKGKF
jgi:hypothetical protein